MTALDPDAMSPAERLGEVCAILAVGIVRAHRRHAADPAHGGNFGLHFAPDRRGHDTAHPTETA